jgi:O-antigen ligase
VIAEAPVFGHGHAYGTRFVVFGQIAGRSGTSHLHNAFLDVLVNNGIVGLVLVVGTWISMSRVLGRALRTPGPWRTEGRSRALLDFAVIFLVVIGLRMITTSALVYHDLYTFGFLGVAAYTHWLAAQMRMQRNLPTGPTSRIRPSGVGAAPET